MTLLVVGSVALDSIYTPFGETADALGGSAVYFSVAGALLQQGQRRRAWSETTTRWRSWSAWPAAASTGAGSSAPTGESFRWKGKYSYDLQSRETLETRLGVFADFQPRTPEVVPRRPVRLPRQHRPGAAAQRAGPGDVADAGGVRHDELLDPEQEADPDGPAPAGGHPDGQRQRGPRALRRLEHPSRRPLDPGARPEAGGHQAGRVRRPADRAGPDLLRPGLSAGGSLRSHRRRRRLRRRVHGLPRARRADRQRAPPARDGLRRRDGVVRGLRSSASRASTASPRSTSSSGCGRSTT